MKRSELRKLVKGLETKYFDLVWLARNDAECCRDDHPAMPAMIRLAKKYPAEIKELKSDNGNWAHGFNSGCLAAFRLVLELLSKESSTFVLPTGWPQDGYLDT